MEPDSARAKSQDDQDCDRNAEPPSEPTYQPENNWHHQVDDGQSVQQRQVVFSLIRTPDAGSERSDSPASGADW